MLQPEVKVAPPPPPRSKGTLLIVDDVPDNITLLLRFLSRAGYEVLSAHSGEQGIELAERIRPDLILLDIMMPGLDGFAVCEHLKGNPETIDIPIIFMSAMAEIQNKVKGLNMGAADYITKPVDRTEVLARVKVHIRLYQLQRELLEKNKQLEDEIIVRKKAELALKELSSALSKSNQELRKEIEERQKIEIALQKANRELERLANLDGLTQIANRRCFDEHFQKEWQRMSREQNSIALILCDIDYFKAYNDTYGHQAGDDCLRKIGQVLTLAAKRSSDLVARYGGEEFVIVLPNTDNKGAFCVAQQIQIDLEQLKLEHSQSAVHRYVTLSIGIAATIPSFSHSPKTFLAAADKALYNAKGQGRNRIVVESI